jgi:predicted nucleotidyltransferase
MDPALKERLRAAAANVFAGHGILAAYAYGSRISGRPRPESDLDVGYYLLAERFEEGLSVAEEMALAAGLSAELGLEVDLRRLDHAPLDARGRVLEEGVRIYSGDDPKRVSMERNTLSFYHDYKETFQRMHEERLRIRAKRSSG